MKWFIENAAIWTENHPPEPSVYMTTDQLDRNENDGLIRMFRTVTTQKKSNSSLSDDHKTEQI